MVAWFFDTYGESIWIVFDAVAKIDLTSAPGGVAQYAAMSASTGPGYSAVRIATRAACARSCQNARMAG